MLRELRVTEPGGRVVSPHARVHKCTQSHLVILWSCWMSLVAKDVRRLGSARSWAWIICAFVVVVGASACGSPSPPPGKGLVVGGIIRCAALAPPSGVQYAAGTVTALEGKMTWRSSGSGTSVAVFPKVVAARESVAMNGSYQFALAPGDYVLQAHFPPPANVSPFISLTVKAGTTEQVDIPNICM